jgi:hypothetical protein
VNETIIPRNPDGSWTIYNVDGNKVTLTFPASPKANFEVVTKDVPAGLPPGYTWLINFGIKNPGGNYLPSVAYKLDATDRSDGKSWYIYYGGSAKPLKGNHTSPGDPPIGTG